LSCKAGHDEVALWKRPEATASTYKWGGPASAGGEPFMPWTPLPEGISKVRRRSTAAFLTVLSPLGKVKHYFFPKPQKSRKTSRVGYFIIRKFGVESRGKLSELSLPSQKEYLP
jgi:hypothetical protein